MYSNYHYTFYSILLYCLFQAIYAKNLISKIFISSSEISAYLLYNLIRSNDIILFKPNIKLHTINIFKLQNQFKSYFYNFIVNL